MIIYQGEIDMDARKVFSLTMMNPSITFFRLPFALFVWPVVHITFNITPLTNCMNMCGNWLYLVHKDRKTRIRVGTCVVV
jgi:hypothetical protein